MRILLPILYILFFLAFPAYAQHYPSQVNKPVYFAKTRPLKDMKPILPGILDDGKDEVYEIITEPFPEISDTVEDPGIDPVLQQNMDTKSPPDISVNAEGMWNYQNKIPPDTDGDVGPDHYIQMVNMSFAVFDKEGTMIYGPVANITIWQDAPEIWSDFSNGDPIVLYDEAADRWLISELSFPHHPYSPHYIKIAVSETADPTGSWYLYGFEYDYFCDYPKFGVWHDGYYMTTNNNYWDGSQWHFHAVGVSVFERDSLLAGSPDARRIFFDLYPNNEPWSVLPADYDGEPPPVDVPAYLAYYKEAFPDRIGIYSVHTDWIVPGNSVIELSETLHPEPFSGSLPDGIPQPGNAPYLSALSNRLMYRLQYRKFDNYQTMVTNHTVNRGNGVAGIRWYEFRDYGSGWQIYQQGTYSPDNTSRWMGSAAMDEYGNIALGYSVSGYDTYPSIRFTGRYKNDPSGFMTVQETEIIAGTGVQLSPYHRWGDYSCMSLDPINQTTFWYTQEYYQVSGDKSWQTRIAAFNLVDPLSLSVTTEKDSICSGDSTQLLALAEGGSGDYTFSWISDPPGFTSAEQNPFVTPDTTMLYICTLGDSVNEVSDNLEVFVQKNAIAYAGPDTLIDAGLSYHIQDALAENHSSLKWGSGGDGIFDDSTFLYATYTPGENDIFIGNVDLFLTAFPLFSCDTVSDTMWLAINSGTGMPADKSMLPYAYVKPNPSNGTFKLVLVNFTGEEIIFTIRQLSGNVIYQDIFISEIYQVRDIMIEQPGSGVYIAELKTSNRNIIIKLLIK